MPQPMTAANELTIDSSTTFVPGFFKIFDEILVNAADNKVSLASPMLDKWLTRSDQRSDHGHNQSQH